MPSTATDSLDGVGVLFREHARKKIRLPLRGPNEGCYKAFTRSTYVIAHQLVHTEENSFRCRFEGCGKAFKRGHNLKDHQLVHTGEKRFRCLVEGCHHRAFTQPRNLKYHQR